MTSRRTRKALLWLALPVLAVTLLAFRDAGGPELLTPTVSLRTSVHREQSISALRAAWNARPLERSIKHERAERAFLNRLAYFVRGAEGSESSAAARRLWNDCYRDHERRYSDFIEAK